jgi:hypothetical protein
MAIPRLITGVQSLIERGDGAQSDFASRFVIKRACENPKNEVRRNNSCARKTVARTRVIEKTLYMRQALIVILNSKFR